MSLQLPPRQRVAGARPSTDARVEVPLLRVENSDPTSLAELMSAVQRVARAGDFTLGDELAEFEREFGLFCGTEHAVGVSSGTDALALTLQALDVGPGDEVIVPANSFIATAEAVTLAGATPRPVDVDPETHLLSAKEIERNLDGRVRCVIPVHLYGRTVDMDPIVSLARERGIRVVEDACQAHGAWYRHRRVGSIGDAGAFSFYPTKNLGGWGDGGAVVTGDPVLAERVRLLRSHGEHPRYTHRMSGGTSRLHTLQAAILRVKLSATRGGERPEAPTRRHPAAGARGLPGRAAPGAALGGRRPRVPSPVRRGRRPRRAPGPSRRARHRDRRPLPDPDPPAGGLFPPGTEPGQPARGGAARGSDLLAPAVPRDDRDGACLSDRRRAPVRGTAARLVGSLSSFFGPRRRRFVASGRVDRPFLL